MSCLGCVLSIASGFLTGGGIKYHFLMYFAIINYTIGLTSVINKVLSKTWLDI